MVDENRTNSNYLLYFFFFFFFFFNLSFNNSVVTVWSAPNYCYRCGNVGAVLEVDEHLNMFFNTYYSAPEEDGSSSVFVPLPEGFD
jgi:serine/threonine-protein phosphatase 4 catalytic subunit